MRTVLYLSSAGTQFWCKNSTGWQMHDAAPTGPVWVVTDLAEERFVEIKVPRIFGSDRRGFIMRQLASHFPDTTFRAPLKSPGGGSLLDRIAPARLVLIGVDAEQRINAALDALPTPIAGVWAVSMLLAQIGWRKSLPADLFVVLPGVDALRIVFIKNRLPVLSRLIPGVTQAADQAAEIVRTLRHLEDSRVLDRSGQQPGVLLLGEPQELAAMLAANRLELLPAPPPWAKTAPTDWRLALFDLALTGHSGQLAPAFRRTKYVAVQLRQLAYAAAAVSLALALWATGLNLRNIISNLSAQSEMQSQTQKLSLESAAAEHQLASYGVPHELLHQAIEIDQQELAFAPSLPAHLKQLGQIIGQQPGLRLNQLEWRIVQPGQAICTGAAPSAASNPPATVTGTTGATAGLPTAVPQHLVEIRFEVTLPSGQPPRARAQTLTSMSAMLTKLKGASLLQDPAKEQKQAALSGGGTRTETEPPPSWCLSLKP